MGDYDGERVRVVVDFDTVRTLIHELGHHVDEVYELTVEGTLTEEREREGHRIINPYSEKDDSEYLAFGFEVYYAGNHVEKERMAQFNPALYKMIDGLHRRHRSG